MIYVKRVDIAAVISIDIEALYLTLDIIFPCRAKHDNFRLCKYKVLIIHYTYRRALIENIIQHALRRSIRIFHDRNTVNRAFSEFFFTDRVINGYVVRIIYISAADIDKSEIRV